MQLTLFSQKTTECPKLSYWNDYEKTKALLSELKIDRDTGTNILLNLYDKTSRALLTDIEMRHFLLFLQGIKEGNGKIDFKTHPRKVGINLSRAKNNTSYPYEEIGQLTGLDVGEIISLENGNIEGNEEKIETLISLYNARKEEIYENYGKNTKD